MAAVLVASTLAALTESSAGAKSGVTKRYGALVVSPSLIAGWSGYGTSKKTAKHDALLKCRQNGPRFSGFAHDCTPAVWVYNGFMAVAYEKTKEDAKYQARGSCRGAAQESCVVREVRHTPHTSQLKTRGGPW